jgi:pyruvate dehydrogenase E2 component (dihydrolipoamide acetyltransferase)
VATTKEVLLPDIGDFDQVDVIEVLVKPGDRVQQDDSLITLESDKATMEIPSPDAGTIKELKVQVGDKVGEGAPILVLELSGAAAEEAAPEAPAEEPVPPARRAGDEKTDEALAPAAQEPAPTEQETPPQGPLPGSTTPSPPPVPELSAAELARARRGKSHASPSVRRFARELGVDLSQVRGSGRKGRVRREDVQAFVKSAMQRSGPTAAFGFAVPEMPQVDFAKFGPVESQPLSRIRRISGANLHRNWISVPHVTQFDEADITGLEEFRRAQKDQLAKEGVKLTLLSFLMKAAVVALKKFPRFNASLDPSGESLVLKRYYHIGVAVDTEDGLVVPVVRNVDQKGLFQLAAELGEVSQKARDKKLSPTEMQGGSFSISSLGGIGGTLFTPIINAPEVAILGISRSEMKPVYQDGGFVPRLILPLSLSYDHRVIDGADAARFTTTLRTVLSDIRHMLM